MKLETLCPQNPLPNGRHSRSTKISRFILGIDTTRFDNWIELTVSHSDSAP